MQFLTYRFVTLPKKTFFKFVFGLLFWALFSCKQNTIEDIELLKGAWEIDFVTAQEERFQPKGKSPLIDFYHLYPNGKGWKKKLSPTLLGVFETSLATSNFIVKSDNSQWILSFQDHSTTWDEQIIHLDTLKLILFHQDKYYHYKRYSNNPIDVQ